MPFNPYDPTTSYYDIATYDLSLYDAALSILTLSTYDPSLIPQNLKAISLNGGTVKLNWQQPISGVISGYQIYRSYADDQQFRLIGSSNNLTYIDSGLSETRKYYYRITSIYSGITASTTPGYTPLNLRAGLDFSTNPPYVNLLWDAPIGLTTNGYGIYRATQNDNVFSQIGSTLTTNYVDSGTLLNQQYYYRVSSIYT